MRHDLVELGSRFKEDGFVLVQSFMSEAETADLDSQLERYVEQVVPKVPENDVFYESGRSGPVKHLSGLEKYDDYFMKLLRRPATIELVEACLGSSIEPIASEVFYKPARVGSAAPYYQDNAYLHLEPAEGAVVWLALDDTTMDNGAVHFTKGSHRLGERRHVETGVLLFSKALASSDVERFAEVPAILRRGDASIHHILCPHRSGPNRTDHHRRGYVVTFKTIRARVDPARAEAHAAYVANLEARS